MIKNPVLGAICGDMIGVPYEWYCHGGLQIPKNFPLWSEKSIFSDDTVMTLAIAKWLLDRPLNSNNLVKIMLDLAKKYPDRGYGGMFRKWLREKHPQPYNSFGNGSAMRVAPVGCAFYTEEATILAAEMSASVSHNHPEGVKGAQAVAALINFYLKESNQKFKGVFWAEQLINEFAPDYNINRTPKEIITSGYEFDSTCQGSVPEAICCFLNSSSYEETIRNAVSLRGDADTQAAIAGSIAAAYWGIPKEIAEEGLDRLPSDLLHILEDFSEKYNLDLN